MMDERKLLINEPKPYENPCWTRPDNPYELLRTRGMQEIIPGIFLGPAGSAAKHCLPSLKQKGIKYIIGIRHEKDNELYRDQGTDPTFIYVYLDIADNVTENIMRYFPRVRQIIDEALSKNCKVLVQGRYGNSRSATLVLAYLMEKYGWSSEDALKFVRERRDTVMPNDGFLAQLFEYEPIYKARQSLSNGGEPSHENHRQKRKSEQLSEAVDFTLIPPPPSPIADNNNDDDDCFQSATDFSNLYNTMWLAKK